MTNYEKYLGDILNYADCGVNKKGNRVEKCNKLHCKNCLFGDSLDCYDDWKKWLNEEAAPNYKIIITTDGTTTKGILTEHGNVVNESLARLHPDDEYDYQTGAQIVFERLLESL